jgi:SAM-dependent methyltransferase
MRSPPDDDRWAAYHAGQHGRPPRDLLLRALTLSGPGHGRTAIDLGCGAGIETRALLGAGWRVLAIDGDPGTETRLRRTIGGHSPRLTVSTIPYADLTALPAADLIYAGYSLPFQNRESFDRIWSLMRAADPRWLAVNIFGVHDSWAGDPEMTFLTGAEARSLTDGMSLAYWHEQDADGPAFSGPKHWHVFDLIATTDVDSRFGVNRTRRAHDP